MSAKTDYRESQHLPPFGYAAGTLLTAARIALRYRGRAPSVRQLQSDMAVSRATAYRWRRAFILAGAEQ